MQDGSGNGTSLSVRALWGGGGPGGRALYWGPEGFAK